MKRITLLTGKNSAGKTAALEAMFIHSGNYNPNLLMVVNALRGVNKIQVDTSPVNDAPWLSAFNEYDDSIPIRLVGEFSINGKQTEKREMHISAVKSHVEMTGFSSTLRGRLASPEGLTVKILKIELSDGKRNKGTKHFLYFEGGQPVVIPPVPMLKHQARFLSPHARDSSEDRAGQFGRIQIEGKVGLVEEALREIDPRIRSLALVFNGEPMLHADIGLSGRKLIPIAVMGDGVSRVATLLLAIGSCPGGTVFVDDIDTGLHYSVMASFWSSIHRAAKEFNVQVIATTHSQECVRGAIDALSSRETREDLSLIRMERQGDHTAAYTYAADDLEIALESGLEVR